MKNKHNGFLICLCVLVVLFLLTCCQSEYHKHFMYLISNSPAEYDDPLSFFIQKGKEGERYLIKHYSSAPADKQFRVIFALGMVGREDSLEFLTELLTDACERPDNGNKMYILEAISRIISEYDVGRAVNNPRNFELEKKRDLRINQEILLKLDHAVSTVILARPYKDDEIHELKGFIKKRICYYQAKKGSSGNRGQ